jgi:predicted RNA-binding protein with TRAM domain
MKKKLLIIIILTFSINFFGQENEKLIERTAEQMGIKKSDIFFRLATAQEFDDGILVVIPEVSEKGEGYISFNNHVIFIDKNTSKIKAEFSQKKDWYSDAMEIDKITIEREKYHLNKSVIAFGLLFEYSGGGRANPFYGTDWSLYELKNDKLNRLLKHFTLKSFFGETDTTCKGKFEEHSKKIEFQNNGANNYADIKITDTINKYVVNENCEEESLETELKAEILKYKNGKYKNVL